MKRIFVVDTDPTARDVMRRALARQDFDVTGFGSPAEALAAVLSDPPELLISDAHLADTSGLDLIATLRGETDPGLPVILISARPTTEAAARARSLGVRHFLRKPVDARREDGGYDDFAELLAAVRRELFWVEASDTVRHLDGLRCEFFVDLSHQLRTPATAMKLAIEGLFSQLRDVMNPSQRNLASIGHRNVERIVALVENQLDLLQMMAGERPVCRRLVDLVQLVHCLSRRPGPGGEADGESVAAVTSSDLETPANSQRLFAFTDPDQLSTIIECIVGTGPPNSRRTIRLDYDPELEVCRLDVRVDYLCAPVSSNESGSAPTDTAEPVSMFDFEYRAYQALLGRIGGDLVMEKDDDHKWVRLYLPRYPSFDRRKDFVDPVRQLRTARSDGAIGVVHFVKCELGERAGDDFLHTKDPIVRSFLDRVTTALSEGDAVIRGKHHGTVYLALRDRSQHELEHLVSFLENGCDGNTADIATDEGTAESGSRETSADGPFVWKPQTIVADEREIDRLVGELERV